MLTTHDAGDHWSAIDSGTEATLNGVAFLADQRRGWIAGDDATLLRTDDAGRTWSDARYERWWAPWYYALSALLAVVLVGLAGAVVVERDEQQDEEAAAGAATTLRSDQPVADKADDRLGYRAAVEALSSFIRNAATEPRVTIAVTGPWGTGKSSVMRMLATDLRRAGFRTAWFNAWHHQQEGRQLSALFNAIRTQAVPTGSAKALPVRSRLIWGRGMFYKAVAIALALGLFFVLGDLLAGGFEQARERMRLWGTHHLLNEKRTAITGSSLAKLDPFARTKSALPTAPAASAPTTNAAVVWYRTELADPCTDPTRIAAHRKAEPVRAEVWCFMRDRLQWDESGEQASRCGVRPTEDSGAMNCVFARAEDLIATIEARDPAARKPLWPSEREAILGAAETLPPPPLFPWLEQSLLGGLAGLLVLLFTKGISVYGLQLSAPLRALLGGKADDSGRESSGTIERYRAEFALLCDALDGRLVVFIDDLDRCTPATVNGVLEMTNYLTDVGRCFIVIGAAMERIAPCIRAPGSDAPDPVYAMQYLNKLVHMELPVPRNPELLGRLVAPAPAAATSTTRAALLGRLRNWSAIGVGGVAAVVLLAAVFALGTALHLNRAGNAQRVIDPVAAAPAAGSAAPTPGDGTTIVRPRPADSAGSAAAGLATAGVAHAPTGLFAAIAALLAAGLGWRFMRRNRDAVTLMLGGAIRVRDSDRFADALTLWNPAVLEHDPTPRHVKRFYNRARLFTAYEQQDRADDDARIDDADLVALAATHHVNLEWLEAAAKHIEARCEEGRDPRAAWDDWFVADTPHRASPLGRLWREHGQRFGSLPTSRQLRRFLSRVSGILVR